MSASAIAEKLSERLPSYKADSDKEFQEKKTAAEAA